MCFRANTPESGVYWFIFWSYRWDLVTWIVKTTRVRTTALSSHCAFQSCLALPAWATQSCSASAQDAIWLYYEAGLSSIHVRDDVGIIMIVWVYQSSATALLYFFFFFFFLDTVHVAQVPPKLLVFLILPLRCWNCKHVPSCPATALDHKLPRTVHCTG